MSEQIFLFDPVERFICGTVGEPGDRTFFIQARTGQRLISVSLEKSQVQAISDRLHILLRELRGTDPSSTFLQVAADNQPLETPIDEEFRVGAISIDFDEASSKVQLDFEELVGDESDSAADILRVRATLAQIRAFVRRADSVISAGRPPCPFCGGPIDSRGHLCPRANGYRR